MKKQAGQVIKYIREQEGQTQEQFGKSINLSQESITKYEKGNLVPIEHLQRIAGHYNREITIVEPGGYFVICKAA